MALHSNSKINETTQVVDPEGGRMIIEPKRIPFFDPEGVECSHATPSGNVIKLRVGRFQLSLE